MTQERRRRHHQQRHHRPPPHLELAMAHARDSGGRHDEEAEAAVCLEGGDSEAGAARGAGRVPPWRDQLTARGMVASLAGGAMYSVIVMKLCLTTGLVPTLNVSAALIAFVVLRGWTQTLARLGVATRPFTRQENTVVQTCAVACYSISVGGQTRAFMLQSSIQVFLESLGFAEFLAVISSPRWVRVLLAWAEQEDLRNGRGADRRQRAGELQGARHRLDDRLPLRCQLRRHCCAHPSQEGR